MKIGILGDFCLSFAVNSVNPTEIIEDFSKSNILHSLNNNRYNVVNLEAPITNSESPIMKTGPSLKNPKEAIDILELMNVQICTLANNHIYDYASDGLKDTLNVCEKNNIKTTGAGLDPQKIREPLIIMDGEIKVAIIAFAENEFNTIDIVDKGVGSNNLDIIEICNQINVAKSKSDYIIIIAHGGHEEYHYPSLRIKKLYRFLIEIGADAVVGHHPHVIQGYEEYNEKPIYYSIGNFLFPSSDNSKANREGFVVILDISKNMISHSILPYTQCVDNFQVNFMEGDQKKEFLKQLEYLSKAIKNDDELEKKWEDFIQSRKEAFIVSIFPFSSKVVRRILKYGLDKFVVHQKHFLKLLNLIRCESHRDILIESLKKKCYHNRSAGALAKKLKDGSTH